VIVQNLIAGQFLFHRVFGRFSAAGFQKHAHKLFKKLRNKQIFLLSGFPDFVSRVSGRFST
jgi:hypothetical protein